MSRLRYELAALLESPQTARIAYSYRGVAVDERAFRRVAQQLRSGRVEATRKVPDDIAAVMAGTNAAWDLLYLFNHDLIVIDASAHLDLRLFTVQAVVVHEAVHAIQDDARVQLSLGEAEIMGYIAQIAYMLATPPETAAAQQEMERETFELRQAEKVAERPTFVAPPPSAKQDFENSVFDFVESKRIHERSRHVVSSFEIQDLVRKYQALGHERRTLNLHLPYDGIRACRYSCGPRSR